MKINRCSNILFITPPYHAGVVESAGRWMPLSYVYLAGALKKHGYECQIYDAMTKQHTLAEVVEFIKSFDFDVVCMSAITSTFPSCIVVLRAIKKIKPIVITILGGVHPSFCYEEILEDHGDIVDFIILGEGENTLPELLNTLSEGKSYNNVKGIAFRDEGKIVVRKAENFIEDLDALETAWDLIDWDDYNYFVLPRSRLAAVSSSRGCSFGCTFCSQQKFWQRSWRSRKPEKFVDEIKMLNKNYGVDVFLITDEYPTSNRERWEEILDRLIFANLGIYLLMETRVEDIVRDHYILNKYKKAGIIHIYIGVEATNQETLDIIKKDIKVEASKEAIDLIRAHGMVSETSFVIGFPWETSYTILQTLELAQHYNPDFAHFLAITPWPYADMYEEVKNFIEVYDYSKYNLVEPVIKPENLTLKDVRSAIVDCYKKYYTKKVMDYISDSDEFRRKYLLRSTSLIMKNSFLTKYLQSNYGEGKLIPIPVLEIINRYI